MREEGKEKRILFIGGRGIISFDSKKFFREREGERDRGGRKEKRENEKEEIRKRRKRTDN